MAEKPSTERYPFPEVIAGISAFLATRLVVGEVVKKIDEMDQTNRIAKALAQADRWIERESLGLYLRSDREHEYLQVSLAFHMLVSPNLDSRALANQYALYREDIGHATEESVEDILHSKALDLAEKIHVGAQSLADRFQDIRELRAARRLGRTSPFTKPIDADLKQLVRSIAAPVAILSKEHHLSETKRQEHEASIQEHTLLFVLGRTTSNPNLS